MPISNVFSKNVVLSLLVIVEKNSELRIIKINSKKITNPTKSPIGKYLEKLSLNREIFISSIITTNKNNTATAPTYTISKTIARNSAFKRMKRIEVLKKHRIKKSTECTGFLEVITIMAELTNIKENKKNKNIVKVIYL